MGGDGLSDGNCDSAGADFLAVMSRSGGDEGGGDERELHVGCWLMNE